MTRSPVGTAEEPEEGQGEELGEEVKTEGTTREMVGMAATMETDSSLSCVIYMTS